jgi:imidazolonepropionase-like amidohydrolase
MRIQGRGAAVAAALLLATPAGAARQDVVALVGGRVLTVSGAPLEVGTVVLRDGLIEAVGADLKVPPDARVIDAKGLTLTPGLIDAFGGVGLPARRPAGRESAERAPREASPAHATVEPDVLPRIDVAEALKARDEGLTTVLVVPREGVLPGRSVLLELSGGTADELVLRQPAALHLQMAPLENRYPGSLMGVMALARQALLDADHARRAWADWERGEAGRRRPRFETSHSAWQQVRAGTLPLIVTAPRENDLRRALALRDEFKVRVVAAGARHASRLAPLLKKEGLPLLVSVVFDPPGRAPAFGGGRDEDAERRDIEEAKASPAALHRAGVRFALVSGHGKDFLGGVRTAVDKGLPREAALRALTLDAAEALGLEARLGSLEKGKLATLVAWQGEPLTADARPKYVFVDGELYEPSPRPERKERRDEPAPSEDAEVGR